MKKLIKLFLLTMITVIPLGAQAKDLKKIVGGSGSNCIFENFSGALNDQIHYCGYTSQWIKHLEAQKENTEVKRRKENRKISCGGADGAIWHFIHREAEALWFQVKGDNRKRVFVCCGGNLTGTAGYWQEVTDIQAKHPTWGTWRKAENDSHTCKTKDGKDGFETTYENVCGGTTTVSECTACAAGTQMRNGACTAICADNQGYESATSNTCVACETTLSQGVDKDGVCQKCSSTQFFNPATQTCKNFNEMLEVTINAHNSCWLCASAGAMLACMRGVSTGGEFSKLDSALQTACGLTGEGASNWSLSGVVDNSNSNHTPISSIANKINNMPYIPIDTIQAAKESGNNLTLHK